MKEYKYIIIGTNEELNAIEHAIDTYLMRNYRAIPKRETSSADSIIFSVTLSLMWYESLEKILTYALRKGLKNSSVYNSNNWLVDIL